MTTLDATRFIPVSDANAFRKILEADRYAIVDRRYMSYVLNKISRKKMIQAGLECVARLCAVDIETVEEVQAAVTTTASDLRRSLIDNPEFYDDEMKIALADFATSLETFHINQGLGVFGTPTTTTPHSDDYSVKGSIMIAMIRPKIHAFEGEDSGMIILAV